METLLRKYLWAIDVLVIALSATFAARATGVMIQSALVRNTPPLLPVRRAAADSGPTTYHDKQVEAILKRNIFCSTCPPILAEPEMDKGIKKTGEHSFEIQRGTVDSMLGNMALLSRSARIVPEVRDGKSAGFRLFSVRQDGPFGRIGLQNGDVISAINGLEMTSPD